MIGLVVKQSKEQVLPLTKVHMIKRFLQILSEVNGFIDEVSLQETGQLAQDNTSSNQVARDNINLGQLAMDKANLGQPFARGKL
jgi:hypothetical protein